MRTRAATSGGDPVGFYGELHPRPPHHHHQFTTSGHSLPPRYFHLPPRATTTLPFPRPVAGPAPSPFRRRAGAPTARCWGFHGSTHGQGGGRWVLPRQRLLYVPMSKLLTSSGFW